MRSRRGWSNTYIVHIYVYMFVSRFDDQNGASVSSPLPFTIPFFAYRSVFLLFSVWPFYTSQLDDKGLEYTERINIYTQGNLEKSKMGCGRLPIEVHYAGYLRNSYDSAVCSSTPLKYVQLRLALLFLNILQIEQKLSFTFRTEWNGRMVNERKTP